MGFSITTTSGKILASVALVGTAAAVAGLGTYGGFTDSTTTADQKVTAGEVVIELGSTGNTLTTAVADLLPGDSVEKFATLTNSGSALNGVALTATTANATVLTTDAVNGLQVTIESCSTTWTPVANGPDTCTPGATSVLATSPIIGANRALSNLASIAASSSDYLKITTKLPATADNTFQAKSSTISFTFDATQRTATVK